MTKAAVVCHDIVAVATISSLTSGISGSVSMTTLTLGMYYMREQEDV